MPCDDTPDVEECLDLAYQYVKILLAHRDEQIRRIGLAILSESTLKQRLTVQMSHAELAELSEVPKRHVPGKLDQMDMDRIITRERSAPGGCGRRGGDTRGDFYGIQVPEWEQEVHTPPTRAGPMRKRPEDVSASPGRQGAVAPPAGSNEPSVFDQDNST